MRLEKNLIANYKSPGNPYPFGITVGKDTTNFSFVTEGKQCNIIFYKKGILVEKVPLSDTDQTGNIWCCSFLTNPIKDIEYSYEIDGIVVQDIFGKKFVGIGKWGEPFCEKQVTSKIPQMNYQWGNYKKKSINFSDMILYNLHVRGFTKHSSSKVKNKGTFLGIVEKIPYLQELGVNAIELMPAYEFHECMNTEDSQRRLPPSEMKKINYWGYTDAYYFSPKQAYASGKDEVMEFKSMVDSLHKAGIELIMEFFFTKEIPPYVILECLKYWVLEYHVDGFHISGDSLPIREILSEPLLGKTKLIVDRIESGVINRSRDSQKKYLAEYNTDFMETSRRLLKSDENQLEGFLFQNRKNASNHGSVNYITNHNGFTLQDLVSYDLKHNEENGEQNLDGNEINYSWNCGVEGKTKRKSIIQLREKQKRNALLMVLLSQGTPGLLSGDEFAQTQNGNNNAYCIDSNLTWIHWDVESGFHLFIKALLKFRKNHPVFRKETPYLISDTLKCGYPDISYHGVKAWYPQLEAYHREVGIMYCGMYADTNTKEDDFFYVAYNFHWIDYEFDLPKLPKGKEWYLTIDTSDMDSTGIYEDGTEILLANQKMQKVKARTILVLKGK